MVFWYFCEWEHHDEWKGRNQLTMYFKSIVLTYIRAQNILETERVQHQFRGCLRNESSETNDKCIGDYR